MVEVKGAPTHWSVIHGAARGDAGARAEFVRCYAPAVRAYLRMRWAQGPLAQDLDDAIQETFVECFRDRGALLRANSQCPGGFRAYLHGVVRNVARRTEKRLVRRRTWLRDPEQIARLEARDEPASIAYDRAWARGIVREATALFAARAERNGAVGRRRAELLRLRFAENLAIRDIAKVLHQNPVTLHADYKRARAEFRSALCAVLRAHHPDAEVDAECARLFACFG